MLARRRLPRGAPPLRGERREAQEPREPRHGLHRPGAPPTAASRPSYWWARARTGRRAGPISGPQIHGHRLPGDPRDPGPHGRLRLPRSALPRGGLRPAGRRGHGRGTARRLLAGLSAGGGRGRGAQRSWIPSTPRSIAHGIESVLDGPDAGRGAAPRGAWSGAAASIGTPQPPGRSSSIDTCSSPESRTTGAVPPPRPMIVGVDASELQGRPTGTGRYLRNLLRVWPAARPRTASSPTSTGRARRSGAALTRGSSIRPSAAPVRGLWWQERALPARRPPRPPSTSSSRPPTPVRCSSTCRG